MATYRKLKVELSGARRVAAMLGYLYLDSGSMSRALARKALRIQLALDDESPPRSACEGDPHRANRLSGTERRARRTVFPCTVRRYRRIVRRKWRSASPARNDAKVRELARCRASSARRRWRRMMEGRDIGTVVSLQPTEIFLDASPEVRANAPERAPGKRRTAHAAEVFDEVIERDTDRERKFSAGLAADAVLVTTRQWVSRD